MTSEKIENMRLFFKGVRIDEKKEQYIRRKIENIEKVLENILKVEVEVDLDKKGKFRVEVMIKIPHHLYRAEETTNSVEESIDLVEEELKTQIRRNSEKMRVLRKRGGRSIKKKVVIDEGARF